MELIRENNPSQPAFSHGDEILSLLLNNLQQSVEELARRFLRSMPAAYLQDIPPQTQLRHIKALLATEATDSEQVISLRNQEGTEFTFISGESYPGLLGKFIRQLPREKRLLAAKVYTAVDGSHVVDVFHFGEPAAPATETPLEPARLDLICDKAAGMYPDIDTAALRTHLDTCSRDYLVATPLEQLIRYFRIAGQVRNHGNVLLNLAPHHTQHQCCLTVAMPDADNRLMFERITAFLGTQGIDIQRAYLDSFGGEAPLSILSFLVQYGGQPFSANSNIWGSIRTDLKRLAYLDEKVFALAARLGDCPLADAEILHTLGRLSYQLLVKQDAYRFSRERIYATLEQHPALALAIAEQFRTKFTPQGLTDTLSLKQRISRAVESPTEQIILQTLLGAITATLRTNLYLPDRFALALRINPAFLNTAGREELPYGVFFVSGRAFDGFHVRFRDIARGGVRIVRPAGREQYALESERHYDECYGLASAQQLKNKDIPEGGSKGVILAKPEADFEAVGHAYADALLDLIAPAEELFTLHQDYLGRKELLYLGPDENVSNPLIEWIIRRAHLRGHPMPNAFMSSKPGAGINHKQYGVTSEGVTVFLETALKEAGIDPRTMPFTVKITGGPDGDVAGNEILILDREYGSHVRILGIADGSGSLEDPAGLDMTELKRLVMAGLPVSAFERSKLGTSGSLVTIHEPEGIQRRNNMHNRVIADAFIPAGGRPRTIHSGNWRDYLSDGGKPSSKVIVEGANLFITPNARAELGKAGVLIIKDSSANKCGVICSSYEIVASMLLTESDFLAHKETYVAEVLEKLRELAATEARSLLRERRLHPDTDLPGLSIQLSRVINRAADLLADNMERLHTTQPELTNKLVQEHIPGVLLEACGERLYTDLPMAYLNRIKAARLASRIVYREGMSWFANRSDAEIIGLAKRYMQEEVRVEAMITNLALTDLAERDAIIHLLEKGGVAAAMRD
ncbi:MAG: NAD-glutamate dehydrogenase [Thiothrix sp.]